MKIFSLRFLLGIFILSGCASDNFGYPGGSDNEINAISTIDQNLKSKKYTVFELPNGQSYIKFGDANFIDLNPNERRGGLRLYATSDNMAFADLEQCIVIHVPKYFVTDFASVPYVLRIAIAPQNYPDAAVFHDYLYAIGVGGADGRQDADALMVLMLFLEGTPRDELFNINFSLWAKRNRGFGSHADYQFYNPATGKASRHEVPKISPIFQWEKERCDKIKSISSKGNSVVQINQTVSAALYEQMAAISKSTIMMPLPAWLRPFVKPGRFM